MTNGLLGGAGFWRRQAYPALIRRAHPIDAAAIAHVYVESWRTSYAGILPPAYLAQLSRERQEQSWRRAIVLAGNATFVAENRSRQVIGFGNGGPERNGNPRYFAELYTLYLLEDYQRQGIGQQLMRAFAQQLIRIGLRSMLVWVLRDNPARGFYVALGGEELDARPVKVGGAHLVEVAYGWRDVRALLAYGSRRKNEI